MPSRRSMLQIQDMISYIPLSYDGDLIDRVSGNVIELSGNGSMVWDATEGMYLITNPATIGQYVGRIAINNYPYKFPLNSFTSMGQIKRKSTTGYNSTPYCSTTASGAATQVSYNNSANLANFPANTLVKSANVIDHQNTNRKYYQQGTLYGAVAEHTPYLPSNWSATGYVYFGYVAISNHYNSQYWVKELYLFNRALTAEEIYKIQGY